MSKLITPDNGPQVKQGGADSGSDETPAPQRETYTTSEIREELNKRGWDDYYELLLRFWQPYLENKSTFDDAIARIVSAL
ncbi:MAG: hypothetical protein WA857_01795 [Candidatus Acidiferrum sp.]